MTEISENSYLRDFSAQVSQIVFVAYLTVLRLITTVWPEMSETSYLRDFSAKVSQIVFLAYLTVVRLIKTVWTEMSESSYLCDFTAQVSQILFLAYLTVLHISPQISAYYNCMTLNIRKLLFPRVQSTSITNRFLSLFDHFTAYYNCMTWNVINLISPRFQWTSITNRFFSWPFYFLLQLYDLKSQKTYFSVILVHKYHKWFS